MRVVLALILFVAVASAIPQTKVHINCSPDPTMNSKFCFAIFFVNTITISKVKFFVKFRK